MSEKVCKYCFIQDLLENHGRSPPPTEVMDTAFYRIKSKTRVNAGSINDSGIYAVFSKRRRNPNPR